ncbi:aminotransferase class I/II-fold pyridoxal phosphate-dependent enzyme [Streptomyces sp. TRM49041]|uniref:aminotransferase class I/II-fold pyridoxal phosphate-dependent enzyme n=1 Tax=Streptomyces sp. TRM49041 TaxID=2603216 RepID=UPI0011F082D7|nr:DegT/DnrJ/EryC1/StrS family aminotransferase [Streptomyces sp. TRM49041]
MSLNRLDHLGAPVLEAIDRYHEMGTLAFAPPGHKQARGADPAVRKVLGDAVFKSDVPVSGGLDDRRASGGVLHRAEQLMADAVHADHALFTSCGSSLAVKAAMLTVAGPHDTLLIGRDAHESAVAGLIVSGIQPVWVEPQWDERLRISYPPSPAAYEAAFERHPDARGALVTSPTAYGACAALDEIARVCHRHGAPLIVDEAWGAHLPFHPDLPSWAMDAGADLAFTSIHKMGSGLEQGSVCHLRSGLVDPAVLRSRADLLGTTSPSVLIYAGLDGWRRQMVLYGRELLGEALRLAHEVRGEIDRIEGLHVYGGAELTGPGRGADFDPLPVVVDVSGLGTTGYRAADWLHGHRSIDVHMSDHRRIGAQLTYADSRATTAPLLDALRELAEHADEVADARLADVPGPAELRMEQVCPPRDAFFAAFEDVPVGEAAGRVAAEMITPHPPGVPVVLPGERLTEPVLTYLTSGGSAGMHIRDAADIRLRTVRVRA